VSRRTGQFPALPGAVVRWGAVTIDAVLRRVYGVFPYTTDPDCFLMVSYGRASRAVPLKDGSQLAKGDPVVELHLWNERMSDRPHSLALAKDFRRSLEELARYLEGADPAGGYRAVHAEIRFVGAGDIERLVAILEHFGFAVEVPEVAGWRLWRAEFWQTFFARWLLFAFNPRASRRQRLAQLGHFEIWLSRERLRERYL
jgi:hypothetical protein